MRTPYDVRRSAPSAPCSRRPPVVGGHGDRRVEEETSHARERRDEATLGLGLGLVVMLATIATRAGVGAQEESAMTAAETRETMEAYAAALLGGGAYETYFADDIVVTMTGVPGEIAGPAAAKAAIDAIHHEQFDAQPEVDDPGRRRGHRRRSRRSSSAPTPASSPGSPRPAQAVAVPYSVFYELADGKITALRIYALAEGLVQQLQAA